jgi:hypothetical protein
MERVCRDTDDLLGRSLRTGASDTTTRGDRSQWRDGHRMSDRDRKVKNIVSMYLDRRGE